MYMNAITVNYAEVGDDHLPISFGFGSKTSFAGETVYNSTITKILDTSCIILQGRDIGTTDIIVSSSLAKDRLLSGFNFGSTSWIKHIIPNISDKNTTYIFYNSPDGYYYKMVENDQGKPKKEKYAPYARILSAADNKNKYPYCEATIKTPVSLNIFNDTVNATINGRFVQIAEMKSSLVVKLENADGSYNDQLIENEYTINTSTYNLDGIKWTRDNNTVTSWLTDTNKIIRSSMSSVDEWTKTIKLLAGDNIVTIPRNKSTITVNFTFTNTYMPSFEWSGAYHNGLENSTMSGNTLTIKNVRQGSSKNLTTFFTGSEAIWFNPSTIDNLPGSGTFNVDISIPTPSVSDTIKFTGWIDGELKQDYIIERPHDILPKTYTIDNMNTESLSNVDIKIDNKATSLLSYINNSTQFKRHRQLTQINKSSPSTRTTITDDNRNPGTTDTDIYIYASNNNVSQIFNVIAHYTSIPAVVSVTNPSDTAAASTNQVVLFEGAYYVANDNMKNLVKSLVSGVTVTAQKEIVRNVTWKTIIPQKYYKMDTIKDGTSVTYTSKFAKITISGISSQVTSVESLDPNLTAQLTNQALSGTDINITIHYEVPDGYSLLNTDRQLILDVQSTIPASDWNKTDTYKFFN